MNHFLARAALNNTTDSDIKKKIIDIINRDFFIEEKNGILNIKTREIRIEDL
jgi:hypothetical protein